MSIIGDVFTGNLKRAKVEIAQDAEKVIKGGIGAATGGVIGTRNGDTQPTADANGVLPRPTVDQSKLNSTTRNFLDRFGQPQGAAAPAQGGGIGGFFNNLLGVAGRAILPQPGGALDQVTGGMVTNGAATVRRGVVAAGVAISTVGAQAAPQTQAPVVEVPPVTASAPAATPPPVLTAAANPIAAPQAESQTLAPAASVKALDVLTPAVSTSVTPKEDFVVAAAAAPAVAAAPAAEFKGRFDADTYARARAFVAKGTEPGGMN